MALSNCGRRIISSRSSFFRVPKRHGFIVLLPEIGDDLPDKNPLLKRDKFPEFTSVTIEKCIAAIGKQTVDFEEGIKELGNKLLQNKDTDLFTDVFHPIEEQCVALETSWGIAKTLYFGNQSVMPTKHYDRIHARASTASAHKYISVPIFEACKRVANDKNVKLTDQQRRLLAKFILEGRLNGLELSKKKASYFVYVGHRIQHKINEFREKVHICTRLYKYKIQDYGTVKEFPDSLLKATAADPLKPTEGPWTITLLPDVYNQFMEYCPDRALRWRLWEADVTKASLYEDKLLSTSITLEGLRDERNDQADTLGYKTYAHLSMETKMAGSLENVYKTLDALFQSARPAQEEEIKSLQQFGNDRGLQGEVQIWDVPYWTRKQREFLYNYREDVLQNYFPLPKVLSGLFNLLEALFNIKIVENKTVDIWHKDVRFFDVFDLDISSTEPMSNFYFDPYARGNEKHRVDANSGWFVPIRSRSTICETTPLTALIFNFQPPVGNKPSLLTFKDVRILFQKFGHALQCLLTKVDYTNISGYAFVEWDAVFITDYFMENWLYEPWVLRNISSHYETGHVLPDDLIDSIRSVRTHMAGFNLCEQLYLSQVDLELYSTKTFWGLILNRLWKKYYAVPLCKKNSHICSFSVIFSGQWAAAYYSNIWSSMIAADLFSAFQEVPNDESHRRDVGYRYRETFLRLSGSCPTSEIFRKFRGRDPNLTALLKNLGLEQKPQKVEEQ